MSDTETNQIQENSRRNRLTIKKKGDGWGLLHDLQNVNILLNGREMTEVRSINIKMGLEEAIIAHVEILDCDLDLQDINLDIKVNELHARILLKKIMDCRPVGVPQDLRDQAHEMTKDLEEVVDVTTRDHKGYRARMKSSE